MGQYWKPVNLTKREYINPHKLGAGLKLWEQLANSPGTGAALIILCAAMPERRGSGDLAEDPVIGRWAGDQIALVGDYAENSDLPNAPIPASEIYAACDHEHPHKWTDITDLVCPVIERELHGKFVGTGWREFEREEV